MRGVIIVFLFFSLFTSSCNNKKQLIEYYDNGNVKSKIEVRNGEIDGIVYTFYPNGKLKNTSEWKNGMLDGAQKFYYPNGKLEQVNFWKQDTINGLSEEYYENGVLRKRAFKKGEDIIGTIFFYDENGKPVEKSIYNAKGQNIYSALYENGKVVSHFVSPIFKDEKDTFLLGENYKTEISFGYKLNGEIKMLVGPFNKDIELLDTLAVVFPDKNGKFTYSTKITKPGWNSLSIKFLHFTKENDSLSVNETGTTHGFFVLPSANPL